jgi:hypothetical protein
LRATQYSSRSVCTTFEARKALQEAGRSDLLGAGCDCLIPAIWYCTAPPKRDESTVWKRLCVGGQDGSRGYLVQAIIALLHSLNDETWGFVQIEPDDSQQKVDILWRGTGGTRVEQVKSSINQIRKADAEKWASELHAGTVADRYRLVLVGPCAQSVVEMGDYQGVEVPCPKNLEIEGLLQVAAHSLDKFLELEGFDRKTATQRELMVNALTTHLSTLSSKGQAMSRSQLVELIKTWAGSITGPAESAWEIVSFDRQRGIENAIAGKGLGPSDTDACPQFPVCDDILAELNRSHFYQIVGTPGCGKSITGWHVAKRLQTIGYSVWRPRTNAKVEELISSFPRSRAILVVDNAHLLGRSFANRISEVSGSETKVLLVSTVQEALQANVICISPKRCVERLATSFLPRREELLPVIRQYDDRVGNRYGDTAFEDRIQQAQKENTPWEFFWVLRGGWRTARREFDSVKQFAHAAEILLFIAAGQIASCDAGVSEGWLFEHAHRAGIDSRQLETSLGHLRGLALVLHQDTVRTKHISYAYRIAEESFGQTNREAWPRLNKFIAHSMLTDGWSLKGISWILDAVSRTDAFRWGSRTAFQGMLEPLAKRCVEECDDIDWASGCLMRLFGAFEVATEEILKHRDHVLGWITSRCGLVSYFCSNIVNELINRRDQITGDPARHFIDAVDGILLADVANTVGLDDLYSFGRLLDRLAFYRPCWAPQFIEHFDWTRIQNLILAAPADHADSVDSFVTGLSLLTRPSDSKCGLVYIESIVPFVTRAINSRPAEAIVAMDGVFWTCLGLVPKFLREGAGREEDQIRVADQIVAKLDPQAFARAMENAISRDLEQLARAFEVLREIKPTFMGMIAACLSEEHFFSATREDWVTQSAELDSLLRFFCIGEDLQPAAAWVRKNQHHIAGPLRTIFVCIAPDVAVEFHKAGRVVQLLGRESRWQEQGFAITRLAMVDTSIAIELFEQQFDEILDAFHKLTLDEPQHLIRFCRALFQLSESLFRRFFTAINLDSPVALETVGRLLKNQHRERRHYRQLAKYGRRLTGRVAELSTELLRRLEAGPS